jgi:HSP20 family molecular chaperone IbpA
MKIRLRSNSVRLRLTQDEVAQFAETGIVEESVELKPQPLVYVLHAADEAKHVEASFCDGWLTISIPAKQAKEWVESEEVGISAAHAGVAILVEKDWQCRHASSEENEGTFPHPEG